MLLIGNLALVILIRGKVSFGVHHVLVDECPGCQGDQQKEKGQLLWPAQKPAPGQFPSAFQVIFTAPAEEHAEEQHQEDTPGCPVEVEPEKGLTKVSQPVHVAPGIAGFVTKEKQVEIEVCKIPQDKDHQPDTYGSCMAGKFVVGHQMHGKHQHDHLQVIGKGDQITVRKVDPQIIIEIAFQGLNGKAHDDGQGCKDQTNTSHPNKLGGDNYPVLYREGVVDDRIARRLVTVQAFPGKKHNDYKDE